MDDKNDIKGEFTVLYCFHLPYQPDFLYHFWKRIREWPYFDARYGKIHRFLLDNLAISNKFNIIAGAWCRNTHTKSGCCDRSQYKNAKASTDFRQIIAETKS